MKSKFKKLLATALVLCLVLALLPAAAFAGNTYTVTFADANGIPKDSYTFGTVKAERDPKNDDTLVLSNSFNEGDQVLITATPNPGCGLVSLVVEEEPVPISDPADGASYSFTINANTVVKAAFRPFHAIAYEDCGGGSVSTSKKQAMREDKVVVTATPEPGYSVESVYYYKNENSESKTTISAVNGVYSFEMPEADVTVGATFKENDKYTITVSPTAGGYVTVKPNGQVAAGTQVTVEAQPLMGYEVTKIVYYESDQGSIGPEDITTSKTFNMPANDVTVQATFKKIETPTTDHSIVLASSITGGEIWSSANSAEAGETVYIYVYPERGWTTKDVYYKTTADSGIVPTWQYLTHEYWKDTQSYEVWSFVMPDHGVYVYADFTYYDDYGTYYIDTSYDSTLGGVEVWVNNNYVGNNWHQGSWANNNDTVSFKVKPYYSDDVVSVSVVGKRTGLTYSCDYSSYSGWYTFTMPNEDVTINVDFRSGVHKVYVDKVTDGKLTVSDDWAKYGQIVYITAVPDYGCTLSSLSVRTATGDSVRVYNAQKADTYYFYMPDQYVSVSAVFTGKYTSLPFNDVSYGDWYYDAVQFVYSKGIMDGVDYYKFAPNGTITRGMIVTMLWRMAGEPFEMPVTSFTDVEIGRYYTTAVAWACRNGIADGMGESTFGPNDAITREELVTLMYRYAQYFGHSCIGTSIEGFADAGSVSSYAYNAMCWAYKAGVVTGTTGSRLNPQGTASRAEAAQMIMSFYSFLNS